MSLIWKANCWRKDKQICAMFWRAGTNSLSQQSEVWIENLTLRKGMCVSQLPRECKPRRRQNKLCSDPYYLIVSMLKNHWHGGSFPDFPRPFCLTSVQLFPQLVVRFPPQLFYNFISVFFWLFPFLFSFSWFILNFFQKKIYYVQSGASSLAKHGGAYFSTNYGSMQDPIAAPGPYENQEP